MFRPENLSLFERNSALNRGLKLLTVLHHKVEEECATGPEESFEFETPRLRSPPKTPMLKLKAGGFGDQLS